MNVTALLLERDLNTSAAPASESIANDPFNLVFIIGFALLISYLAMVIARRGGKRK